MKFPRPERFTRSAQPSVCRSRASPARTGGSCRTHTVCKGTGASTFQYGAYRTCSVSQWTLSMSRRRRRRKPAEDGGAESPAAPAQDAA